LYSVGCGRELPQQQGLLLLEFSPTISSKPYPNLVVVEFSPTTSRKPYPKLVVVGVLSNNQ